MLKTLRHPNIVKYIYSEESPLTNASHFKCLIITELIRPLTSVIAELSKEQLIRGMFNITNAISFLHEQVCAVDSYFFGELYLSVANRNEFLCDLMFFFVIYQVSLFI